MTGVQQDQADIIKTRNCWPVTVTQLDSEETVPCCYFLLPDKKRSTYISVFECLKNNGVEAPDICFLDFELPVADALKEVYGDNVNITMCDVHYKRNIDGKFTEVGLGHELQTDASLQVYRKMIWALTLVPPASIPDYYANVVKKYIPIKDEETESAKKYNNSLERFESYFEANYAGAFVVNRKGKVYRKNPRFAYTTWSKFDNIMLEEDRTTNRAEAFNLQIEKGISCRGNVWKVCKSLRKEDGLARQKILESNRGIVPEHFKRTSHTQVGNKKKQLKALCSKFVTLEAKAFMKQAVNFYGEYLFE